MEKNTVYPPGPNDVPNGLTQPNANFKKHAWLAMTGLMVFMALYLALMVAFGWITYSGVMRFAAGNGGIIQAIVVGCTGLLTVFMVKSLFAVRKAGEPGGVEITQQDEPALFDFLNTLADDIGAPRPHRVFLTPEVNAAVFYDLSLLNLFFPSKKNLNIGLGLVNVLNLGELKAVLAHEFGHFAQSSMMIGRWVYIAQQIIAHMVATRDWLDTLVRTVSRIDLRVAWIGWILSLVLWSIRSLVDTLFSVVIMAERALSREMEFNADLVAVSVTGSDALVHALHKLQSADHAWQTALNVADSEARNGYLISDLFASQRATLEKMRTVLNDEHYGKVPEKTAEQSAEQHRVFTEMSARPPQMWATHPANRDREDNAKSTYVAADIDNRDAWVLFQNPEALKHGISQRFYNIEEEKKHEVQTRCPIEAVENRFSNASYAPEYRGTYLNRSVVRDFDSVTAMLNSGEICQNARASIAQLYPQSITDALSAERDLDIEKHTLEALASGALKPSGGVIRHRGNELKKKDIPGAIEDIANERQAVTEVLKAHDASCRRAHLQAAKEAGLGWHDYLLSLIQLLHCAEHMAARLQDERALLVNTWMVITADKQIGYFEKRRMIRVCQALHPVAEQISQCATAITLPTPLLSTLNIESWQAQCPQFSLPEVTNKNWADWCQAADQQINNLAHALGVLKSLALEELINTEALLRDHLNQNTPLDNAPACGEVPSDYPLLLPGNEHQLQQKLDVWNRFQLAHGTFPTLARLVVAIGIVGGALYSGIATL